MQNRKVNYITMVSLYYNNPNHSMIYFFDCIDKIGFRVHRGVSKDGCMVSYSTSHKVVDCKDADMIRMFDDIWNEVGLPLSTSGYNMHVANGELWNKVFSSRFVNNLTK